MQLSSNESFSGLTLGAIKNSSVRNRTPILLYGMCIGNLFQVERFGEQMFVLQTLDPRFRYVYYTTKEAALEDVQLHLVQGRNGVEGLNCLPKVAQ